MRRGGHPASPRKVERAIRTRILTLTVAAVALLTPTAAPAFASPAAVAAPITAAGPAPALVSASDWSTSEGAYTPVTPTRVIDTRAAGQGKPASGATLTVPVGGVAGVPTSGVRAVVVNLTVTEPVASGWLTAYARGESAPATSSLNYAAGWTGATLATVPTDASGTLSVYVHRSTHVIVDVVGYYRAAGAASDAQLGSYVAMAPTRAFDSRVTTPLPGRTSDVLALDFGPNANPHVRAVAVNVTVVQPQGPGWLTAYSGDPDQLTTASTLNFDTGAIVPNMAITPTGVEGTLPTIGIHNWSSKPTHYIVDVVGYYDDNTLAGTLRFRRANTPTRIVDTRINRGFSRLGAKGAGTTGVPTGIGTSATGVLVTNLTAVLPTQTTWLTVWPAALARPSASNLNPGTSQTVANMAMITLDDNRRFSVWNAVGSVDVLVDVVGTLERVTPVQAPARSVELTRRTTASTAQHRP